MDESQEQACLGDEATISELRFEPCHQWMLEVSAGRALRRWMLREGEVQSLGSSSSSDVRIDDLTVSGRHAEVGVKDGRLWVRDVGSRNGIFASGARVPEAFFDRSGCFVVGRTLVMVSTGEPPDDDASILREEPLEGVVGQSVPMLRLARAVRRLAGQRAPVLIRGETGSGKELVAQALHRLNPAARGAFVPLNMGALAPELVDSELFGHERGAFSGAVASRVGAIEAARGGTLFLDEVAELPLEAQAKLLRTLENGEVRPVGASQPRKVEVRVVAASWASLSERVTQRRFREDLYHRLAVFTIEVPPLRDRKGDLPLLARGFLNAMASEVGERALTSTALSRLARHAWPGNVRELRNVLLRAAVMAPSNGITGEHIERALAPFTMLSSGTGQEMSRVHEAMQLLEQNGGNVSATARAMGVARTTLRGWMKSLRRSG